MTKVTMPDPVAYAHRDILRRGNCVERIYPTAKHGSESVGLITTDQAEAYANARVREALEQAAGIIKANAEACDSGTRIMLRANAEAVLALISSTPARPESE